MVQVVYRKRPISHKPTEKQPDTLHGFPLILHATTGFDNHYNSRVIIQDRKVVIINYDNTVMFVVNSTIGRMFSDGIYKLDSEVIREIKNEVKQGSNFLIDRTNDAIEVIYQTKKKETRTRTIPVEQVDRPVNVDDIDNSVGKNTASISFNELYNHLKYVIQAVKYMTLHPYERGIYFTGENSDKSVQVKVSPTAYRWNNVDNDTTSVSGYLLDTVMRILKKSDIQGIDIQYGGLKPIKLKAHTITYELAQIYIAPYGPM